MEGQSDELTRCSALPESERLQAAQLAAQALPVIYDLVGNEVVPMLAEEFRVEGSELGDAVAIFGDSVTGLVASYPADQYQSRQRVSLHHALRSLSPAAGARLVTQLRSVSDQIPKDELHGQYVARFAVSPGVQGSGVADRLMSLFVAQHPVVTLHVRNDNARAIAFYRRHGFVERRSAEFLLMVRE